MKSPTEIIAERVGPHEAAAVMALLKETGWIVVRHDAIRLAQADEREWQRSRNKPTERFLGSAELTF